MYEMVKVGIAAAVDELGHQRDQELLSLRDGGEPDVLKVDGYLDVAMLVRAINSAVQAHRLTWRPEPSPPVNNAEIIAKAVHVGMRQMRCAKSMVSYEYEEYEAEWLLIGSIVCGALGFIDPPPKM